MLTEKMTREGSLARGLNKEGSMARTSQGDRTSTREESRSRTPPGTPRKGGKLLSVRVQMLDDSITLFQVQAKAAGRMLFEQVCKQLNLLETDYFGLEYMDTQGVTYWLDRDKPMSQQVSLPSNDPLLRFVVKFYMPDPSQLEEEYTRYLAALQVKRDLAAGQLHCNDNTAALMASYIVQAECGDYVGEDYPDHTYLSTYKFIPGQDEDLERKIMENHKKHMGQSPAEADLNLLETARRCELYGTKMHAAKDHEGVPLNLAVAHMGVLVFQNFTKINTFSWAKIRKLSFKRKKFLIKLHPEGYGYCKDIIEFYFEERNQCKNFWKKCVEHHGFFRCTETPLRNREKPKIISRGSSFRYSGRTQKQMQEHVRENFVKRQSFQRHVRSLHGSTGNVGVSISAQPLLPLADNQIVGTSASLSCGSMNLFPDDHRSVYSTGRTVSRLRDFDDFSMDSPYSGRRPSSHTAFVPQPVSPGSIDSSPRRNLYGDHRLPNFHHDHLHHQEHDQLGVNTLQPNTQRRERAREALLRRNQCDFSISIESATTNSVSSMTGTTEAKTDQTVVQNFANHPPEVQGNGNCRSNLSLHSNHSDKSEELNSMGHLSSEDNLSHESYDLIDKEEEAQINTYSENLKTVLSRSELSFDNSASYTMPMSVPHTPNRSQNPVETLTIENDTQSMYSRDEMNSNASGRNKNSHSSSHSSRVSINSSGVSTSPLQDSIHLQDPNSSLSRRRSSGSGSQKSSSKSSNKNGSCSRSGSRISLKEAMHENQNAFQGHEGEIDENLAKNANIQIYQRNKIKPEVNRNGSKVRNDSRDSGMHESLIFQSPTNLKYFSSHISPQPYNSRTLPGKKRREKSPIIFTRGKLSADCSSNSSSSHASPKISRPKSLDFSVVALTDLPNKTAYSFRDDTIDQHDFEDSSSALSVQNELNYASSSDIPPTPENAELPVIVGGNRNFISIKPNFPYNHKQHTMPTQKEERIYDIPEGVEKDDPDTDATNLSFSSKSNVPPVYIDHAKFKSYLEISGKFSSEDSESVSNRQFFKPMPPTRVLAKVSSTESESAPSNNSVPAAVQFDSDTLSLPLDLLSPPMESESSTALVDSESLPAPPQFGSNKDDTDIDEEVTPKGEDMTPDSLDICSDTNTMKKKKVGIFTDKPTEAPVFRQESTYERSAEAILESQTTIDSTSGDIPPMMPQREQPDVNVPINGRRRESALLRALDTFDSFNLENEFPVTKRQESTYEDRAEAMLEKQTTIDSFTSQTSVDDNVFFDSSFSIEGQSFNAGKGREAVLESQSTLESFTTECEVLVTKRQESTYEERAEALLESQNTIDSFTTEVPNDEIYNDANEINEDDMLKCIQPVDDKEIIVSDLYVRHVGSNDSVSTNGESDPDAVPYIDEGFDSADHNECTCGEPLCFKNIIPPPLQQAEPVYIPPPRIGRSPSFDCPPPPLEDECQENIPDLPNTCLDFPSPFDSSEQPPPFPPDNFGSYVLHNPGPLVFREGFHGVFPQRTLSRISEKSSNESGSPQSDLPAAVFNDNTSTSDQEEPNYTTSEDNENAPSISSDLPENMGNPLDGNLNQSFEDVKVEYNNMPSPPSSNAESAKVTEYTQIDQETLEEDLDDTNADEIKTEERISPIELPVDVTNSISSENYVSHKDSEGSLHDSMEILEDVNTIDHFENDPKQYMEGLVESVNLDQKNNMMYAESQEPSSFLPVGGDISDSSGRYVVKEGTEELMF